MSSKGKHKKMLKYTVVIKIFGKRQYYRDSIVQYMY